MSPPLVTGFVYFMIVFATGFVLGVIRVLVVIPRTGEIIAVLIELPLILTASWIVCASLISRFQVAPKAVDRIMMGASAFAFLLVAEIALSTYVFGNSIDSTLVQYLTLHGFIGLCGQLAFAAFPLLQLLRR